MTPDQALAIYEKKHSKQIKPFVNAAERGENGAQKATRIGGMLAKKALSGLAGGTYDTLALGVNAPTYLANYMNGDNVEAPIFYITPMIEEKIDEWTGNRFQPKTDNEKLANAAINFIAGGKGTAAGSAGKAGIMAPKNLRDYMALGGAGVGSEYLHQMEPDNALLPLLGGVAGGVAGGAIPGAAKFVAHPRESIKDMGASLLGMNPEKLQTMKNAGLTPTLANVSDNRMVGISQNILGESFGSHYPLQKIAEENIQKIEKLNTGLPREQAGELAIKGLNNTVESVNNRTAENRKVLDKYFNPADNIDANNITEYLNKKPALFTSQRQKAFKQSYIGQKRSELEEIFKEQTLKKLQPYLNKNNKQLSFDFEAKNTIPLGDALDIRDELYNNITTFGLHGNKTQGQIKRISALIAKDAQQHFDAISPEAGKAFSKFNKDYTRAKNLEIKITNKLLNNKTATEVFRSVMSDSKIDAKYAKLIHKNLSKPEQEILSNSFIKELGSNAQNEFNGASLATNFKKLDPNAQDVVLSGLSTEQKNHFKSTIDSLDLMKKTANLGNTSRTAYIHNAINMMKTAVQTAGAIGLGQWAGLPIEALAFYGAGIGASYKMFANPKFIDWLASAKNIKNPKEYETAMSKLYRIARAEPMIAKDIEKYMKDVKVMQETLDTPEQSGQTQDLQERPEQPQETIEEEYPLEKSLEGNPFRDLTPDEAMEMYLERNKK